MAYVSGISAFAHCTTCETKPCLVVISDLCMNEKSSNIVENRLYAMRLVAQESIASLKLHLKIETLNL